MIATLAGAVPTVLILPAVTRQWDDRQKERELKAEIVDQAAVAWSSRAMDVSSSVSTPAGRTPVRDPLRDGGLVALRIDAKLRAYFPPSVVNAWRRYQFRAVGVAAIAGTASPLGRRLTDSEASYIEVTVRRLGLEPAAEKETLRLLIGRGSTRATQSQAITNLSNLVNQWDIAVVDQILGAHLEGFSTTRRDLVRDLLP